jgi:hypothetical protein
MTFPLLRAFNARYTVCPICGHFFERDRLNVGGLRNAHATDMSRDHQNRIRRDAWVKLAVVLLMADRRWERRASNAGVTAEVGEFVTSHALFVNRRTRRNGTRRPPGATADLQYAKNGHYK